MSPARQSVGEAAQGGSMEAATLALGSCELKGQVGCLDTLDMEWWDRDRNAIQRVGTGLLKANSSYADLILSRGSGSAPPNSRWDAL